MAVRGAEAKEIVKNKIMSTFEGAFIASDGKTLRIPIEENGETVEIKVSLVAAKDLEGGLVAVSSSLGGDGIPTVQASAELVPPTEEELEKVHSLMAALNL